MFRIGVKINCIVVYVVMSRLNLNVMLFVWFSLCSRFGRMGRISLMFMVLSVSVMRMMVKVGM